MIQTSLERLTALNVEICVLTGAGQGHATTQAAIDRYFAMLADRASEVRAAVTEARADTQARASHAYIDGIAAALTRALIARAKRSPA